MRKLALAMALASTALATPALARDKAWYVGVEGGAVLVEDMDLDITTANIRNNNAVNIDHKIGYDVGGVVGYDFGGFRLETEVSYRAARADDVVSSGARFNDAGGGARALSFMLNGMFDFGPDDGLQGYVGGGVGVARTKVRSITRTDWLNDSDTGFAWQAIAGIRTPISRNADIGLRYRFFNHSNVDLIDAAGRDAETRFRSHSLMATLNFNFGEPAPPPAPPEPVAPPPTPTYVPPAPTPPRPPVCNSGPYIVFFDWDKDNITADAAQTLDNAISAYRNCGNSAVTIAGNADRSGNARYNVGLSQRRANNVQSYLTARGIPGSATRTIANGENNPRVPTPDGVRNDQNRNVQINYGPGSGS